MRDGRPPARRARKNDGGHAFPIGQLPGLSVRDYFAAAALQAVMFARTALNDADLASDLNQESIAEECYELADALLNARAKEAV